MARGRRRPRFNPKKPVPPYKEAGYKSSLEYDGAMDLEQRGVKFKYEPTKIPYTFTEEKVYIPDFEIEGLPFYIEFKGWLTPEDRKKMLRVRDSNPDKEVRFVFSKASNKITKGSKTTYADWCEKHGFKWAEKTVPESWLNERKPN